MSPLWTVWMLTGAIGAAPVMDVTVDPSIDSRCPSRYWMRYLIGSTPRSPYVGRRSGLSYTTSARLSSLKAKEFFATRMSCQPSLKS